MRGAKIVDNFEKLLAVMLLYFGLIAWRVHIKVMQCLRTLEATPELLNLMRAAESAHNKIKIMRARGHKD